MKTTEIRVAPSRSYCTIVYTILYIIFFPREFLSSTLPKDVYGSPHLSEEEGERGWMRGAVVARGARGNYAVRKVIRRAKREEEEVAQTASLAQGPCLCLCLCLSLSLSLSLSRSLSLSFSLYLFFTVYIPSFMTLLRI